MNMNPRVNIAMAPATTAPPIPTGLTYGRSDLGILLLSTTNATICMKYVITAPNTAMFSSTAPTGTFSPKRLGVYSISSATAKPTTAPARSALCGVWRSRWVTESHFGKYPDLERE